METETGHRRNQTGRAIIRARLLKRFGERRVPAVDGVDFPDRLAAASDDIRNALVPVQTVASLLQRDPEDPLSRKCVSILHEEVRRIVTILESLGS